MTEGHAKRFFVAKILAQAEHERVWLSPPEREMLTWSESGTEKTDPTLPGRLETEISDEQCEKKIAGLAQRAYDRDVAASRDARSRYEEAYRALNRGDHYLLVMLDQVQGLKPGTPWWRITLIGVVAVAALFGLQIVVARYLGHDPSRDEEGFFAWAAAMALGCGYLLTRSLLGCDRVDRIIGRVFDALFGTGRD